MYENAAKCFDKAGVQDRASVCRQTAHRLGHQPELTATIADPEGLVLGEWDGLIVVLANAGFGSARSVRATVEGPFSAHNANQSTEIAAGETTSIEIAVRPNEAGRRVPITVHVSYEDDEGAHQLPPVTKLVQVARV